ncbi:phage tail protein, partial [Francisella tularensis subsp. holarctica]|nr:phage tail protein [Francisella tularensis subsp. holarctica]
IEIVQEVIIYFEKNNLNYNSYFKIQLNKTLRKIISSLILKDQKNDTYSDKESINQVEETITDQKTIPGSEKWKTLIEKIEFLKALVES